MVRGGSEVGAAPFEPGSLTDIAGAPALFDRHPGYELVLRWMDEFITRPDPRLNRTGPVCPRVAPARRQNLIHLVTVRTSGRSAETAVAVGPHLADLFEQLLPAGPARRAGSLLALFPDVAAADGPEFIDRGHRLLRMGFVERGLMIGEFHPDSEVASVHNPGFRVMRSPVPMFAVRALSIHDLMFLDIPGRPIDEREAYLVHYLAHLGDELTDDARCDVHDRLRAIGRGR
jgi:hypothetical protein